MYVLVGEAPEKQITRGGTPSKAGKCPHKPTEQPEHGFVQQKIGLIIAILFQS